MNYRANPTSLQLAALSVNFTEKLVGLLEEIAVARERWESVDGEVFPNIERDDAATALLSITARARNLLVEVERGAGD